MAILVLTYLRSSMPMREPVYANKLDMHTSVQLIVMRVENGKQHNKKMHCSNISHMELPAQMKHRDSIRLIHINHQCHASSHTALLKQHVIS